MFKTIFLDVDDTVFDFEKAQRIAICKAFEKLKYPMNERIYELYDKINISHWKKLERGETIKEKLVYDRFYDLFNATGINGDVIATESEYQKNLGEEAFWWEGALEGVKYLSKKYDIFITTNGHGETQKNRIKKSGLNNYIKGLFISEIIGFAKPQIEYYEHCFRESGAKIETTLCIGDSLSSDIRGGINAGIKTMWFNPKHLVAPENFRIDYIVSEWKEICQIL